MKAILRALVVLWACAAAPADAAAEASPRATPPREADIGPAALLESLRLPSDPGEARLRHGLEYHDRGYAGCQEAGWYAPRKEVPVRLWFDENGNGAREESEFRQLNAQIFQRVTGLFVHFDTARANRISLEEKRRTSGDFRLVPVGDFGVGGPRGGGAWTLEAMRGALRLSIEVRSHAAVPEESRDNEVPQRINWIRHNRASDMEKSLATSGSKKRAYEDWAGAVAALRGAEEGQQAFAVQVAQAVFGAFERWACRSPLATAPGMKGLYDPDVTPYWPRAEELPKHVEVKPGTRLPEEGSPSAFLSLRSKDGLFNYDLSIQCHTFSREDLRADAPLALAMADFEKRWRYALVSGQDFGATRTDIALEGADEAVRLRQMRSERVAFRCANVVVIVEGNGGQQPWGTFASEEIARCVLAKLTRRQAEKPKIAAPQFLLEETEPTGLASADGRSSKGFVVRCLHADGSPAAGVRILLTLDDSALPSRGSLSTRQTVTNSTGEARFQYRPPNLPLGSGDASARVRVSATGAFGNPVELFNAETLFSLAPRKTLPLRLTINGAQVLDTELCNKWVIGKPALVRLKAAWDPPDIKSIKADLVYRLRGREIARKHATFKWDYSVRELQNFMNIAYAALTPEEPAGDAEIVVEVIPTDIESLGELNYACPAQSATMRVTLVRPKETIRVRFIPLALGAWSARTRLDPVEFSQMRDDTMQFLRGIFPLPPSHILDVTDSEVMMKPEAVYTEHVTGIQRSVMLNRLQGYRSVYGANKYDFYVGVHPEDWISEEGLQSDRYPNAVLIKATKDRPNKISFATSLAHEIGHHFKFKHARDQTLLSGSGAWLDGNYEPTMQLRMTEKQRVVLDFMYASIDGPGQMWISVPHYERLLQQLTD